MDTNQVSSPTTVKIGKRGTIVIPARLRRKFALDEGSLVILEEQPEGLLVRPAISVPLEIYTDERKAEFLLGNAVDAVDYQRARREVETMGLDPDAILHDKPAGA